MSKVYQCIECGYCDDSNTNWRGYVKCTKLGIFVDPHGSACYRSIEKPQTYRSNCYLTTAMCSILKFDDNCKYLNTLRTFRDNYMKHEPMYLPLLIEYDVVGPLISNNLNNDINKTEIATKMLNHYIIPAVICIEAQDYDQAIDIYTTMTKNLVNYYNIPFIQIPKLNEDTIDMSTLGKARVREAY